MNLPITPNKAEIPMFETFVTTVESTCAKIHVAVSNTANNKIVFFIFVVLCRDGVINDTYMLLNKIL